MNTLEPQIVMKYNLKASSTEVSQTILPYQNMFSVKKDFELNSSHPEVLSIVKPSLVLMPNETGQIEFAIMPMEKSTESKVLVFICDTSSGRAEVLSFIINYTL